jgi:hypothetical protein
MLLFQEKITVGDEKFLQQEQQGPVANGREI